MSFFDFLGFALVMSPLWGMVAIIAYVEWAEHRR